MQRAPRILMAGGGTGGHVYPAIAIARAIRALEPEAAIAFAGTRDHLEWKAVPQAGFAIHPITISGFHRKRLLRNVSFPYKLARGLLQSLALVGHFDADVAVGTGGYVSGPVLLAASLRGRPIVTQEQNAYAGITNRLLARRAAQIHIAFSEVTHWFPKEKCRLSGNPTRQELLTANPAEARAHFEIPGNARVLFVFGGSLGSLALNTAMEQQRRHLLSDPDLVIIWQTGRLYYKRLQARVAAHPRLRLVQYVHRMDLAYAAADLVLCRAGAITCSELLATGTPAILVPSPHVAEDHQTRNAESLHRSGAAFMAPENELEAVLTMRVPELLCDDALLAKMAAAARAAARPNAARDIAQDILRLIGWRSQAA